MAGTDLTRRTLLDTAVRAALACASTPTDCACPSEFNTGSSFTRFIPPRDLSSAKQDFDRASGVTGWTLHDLRRTARSLMSRAGVPSDHAERCLGHVIGGVRGTYDRHEYHEEKRLAFEALASLIARIIDPQPNVVAMRGER